MMVLTLALAALSCRDGHPPLPLSSSVEISDPRAAAQLVSGFHSVEEGSWRWTEKRFALKLGVPDAAKLKGATFRIDLTVPDVIIARFQHTGLSCRVNDVPLAPETFTQAGRFAYVRELPAMGSAAVAVECAASEALPSSATDSRERGLVLWRVSLENSRR